MRHIADCCLPAVSDNGLFQDCLVFQNFLSFIFLGYVSDVVYGGVFCSVISYLTPCAVR